MTRRSVASTSQRRSSRKRVYVILIMFFRDYIIRHNAGIKNNDHNVILRLSADHICVDGRPSLKSPQLHVTRTRPDKIKSAGQSLK